MAREARGREVTFYSDPLNERVVVAAAMTSLAFRKEQVPRIPPDTFLSAEHPPIWGAIRESLRQGLEPTPATLARLAGEAIEVRYVEELLASHPDVPAQANLARSVENLLWDHAKHIALTGPISALLDSIGKNEGQDRVRGLATAVARSFDGWTDRKYLLDPERLVETQMADITRRVEGRASFPYGIQGLDFDLATRARRMVPGAAPKQITVVTGVPGSGKSTTTCRIVLGLARQKRKVLYGAWEMQGGPTLELLALQSLAEQNAQPGDWSRTKLTVPQDYPGWLTDERKAVLRQRMVDLSKWVRFLENPFRRSGEKRPSNERNLDLVAGYVADSGCDVLVADLWKRCLAATKPEDEEEALIRQQAIVEELGVHAILVQQQRLKDIEMREDKRPTREGIKGSGAWVEVADNILGVHRPHLWKPVEDSVLEVDVLKQRYGRWPIAIEFAWNADRGTLAGGETIAYDVVSSRAASTNSVDKALRDPKERRR